MTIRCILLALLALFGCAEAPAPAESAPFIALDAELTVSAAFSGDERAQIDGAVADWYRATGGSVRFELVRRAGESPWRVERSGEGDCNGRLFWLGCTRPAARRMDVNADAITLPGQPFFASEFRALVLHELGHMAGLGEDVSPLMSPGFGGGCIDEATLIEVCERRGCAEFRPTCQM